MSYEIELMRLLCQLAACDGEVVRIERDSIFRRARSHGVPEAEVEAQERCLEHRQLPEPDMGILRSAVGQTRAAARSLLAVDGVLNDAEIEALGRLDRELST